MASIEATEATSTMTCPYCGGEIPSTARKCRHCGEWLGARAPGTVNVPIRRLGVAVAFATGVYAAELVIVLVCYLALGGTAAMAWTWLILSWVCITGAAYWWQGRDAKQ